jgi:hypothetical protein
VSAEVKVIKKDSQTLALCDTLADVDGKREASDPLRELYLNEWQTLIMRLSALAKYLGISRRCKRCGSDL